VSLTHQSALLTVEPMLNCKGVCVCENLSLEILLRYTDTNPPDTDAYTNAYLRP
jgi:hypothetical protein